MRPRIEDLLANTRIGELPRRKVCRVSTTTSLGEVYRLLDEEHSVAVLVCEGERLLGIFTERDVLQRTALEGDPATAIGELMERDVVTLDAEQRVSDAIGLMVDHRIRHLPVVTAGDQEAGLIGGRDVLRMIAEHYPRTFFNLPPSLDQQFSQPEGA